MDFDACIFCDRCIRGCSEIRDNFVLGRMGKGSTPGSPSTTTCPWAILLRFVRRMHGFLPHRRAHQQKCHADCNRRAPDAEPVALEELQQLPFFKRRSGTFLSLNRNAVVRRHFKRGEVICREGEYGSTAFYILEGEARSIHRQPHRARENKRRRRKAFSASSPAA